MRFVPTGSVDIIKIRTERDAIPGGAAGLVDFVPGAAGIESGFPVSNRLTLTGVDLDASAWWIFPATGVWRITAALTRGDATLATYLHHQLRFFRYSSGIIDAVAAYDSCTEPQPDPGGIISGFTPPIVWTGFAAGGMDTVGQYLEHNSPNPIDAAGSLTIEYLGHDGRTIVAGGGLVDERPGPWGDRLGADLPGPGPGVVTYGPT